MRRLTSRAPLPLSRRVTLAVRIVACYAQVRRRLAKEPLPALAASFGDVPVRSGEPIPARQLGWAIDRTLRIGSRRPRCIFNALVLYRLLREQGDEAVLVVGLPEAAINKDAHAWVELNGDGRGAATGPGRAPADGEVHVKADDCSSCCGAAPSSTTGRSHRRASKPCSRVPRRDWWARRRPTTVSPTWSS